MEFSSGHPVPVRFHVAAALVLAWLAISVPNFAGAQETLDEDDSRARIHFQAGRDHYDEGAYDQAYIEFERAYELSHRPEMLLNMASVLERLARHEEAAEALERYLEARPDDPNRSTLERRVENLRRLASSMETSEPEDSSVDPEPAAEARTEATVVVESEPADSSAPPRAPSGGRGDGLFIGSMAALGVGALGLITFGAFGGLAADEYGAVETRCGAAGVCTQGEIADIRLFSALADVGWISALLGASVGTILLVLSLNADDDRASASNDGLRLVPFASMESAGLFAQGNF